MERTMNLTPVKAMRGRAAAQVPPLSYAPTMAERVARAWILRGADGCGLDENIGEEAVRSPATPASRSTSH